MPNQYDKKENGKNDTGRPSLYEPKYCDEMIAFFDIPLTERVLKSHTTGKNEYEKDEYVDKPNPVPYFTRYARNIGVHINTLNLWREEHPEFMDAYNTCKEIQKEFLVQNGLAGHYPPASFIFVAKNITDMRDVQETKLTGTLTYAEALRQGIKKNDESGNGGGS